MITLLALVLSTSAQASCYIPVYVVEDSIPDQFYDLFTADLMKSMGVWNNLGAPVVLTYMGKTESRWLTGAITVGWSTDPGSIPDSIANTYNTKWPSGETLKTKIELLSTKPWCPTSSNYNCINMRNVITHELGHALGLGHVEDDTSVMRSSEPRGWAKIIVPNDDDINDLKALYPPGDRGCSRNGDSLSWNTSRKHDQE